MPLLRELSNRHFTLALLLQLSALALVFIGWTTPCFSQSPHQRSVLIYLGAPKEGFGDLATNIHLARYLKKIGTRTTLVWTSEHFEKLSVLLPELKNTNKPQKIDGMVAVRIDGPIPQADFLLQFSHYPQFGASAIEVKDGMKAVPNTELPPALVAKAKAAIVFSEYTGLREYVFGNSTQQFMFDQPELNLNDNVARAFTGPKNLGLYISDEEEKPPLDRNEFFKLIASRYAVTKRQLESSEIAYAYASNSNTFQNYMELISFAARERKFKRPVIILTNQEIDPEFLSELRLPNSVTLVQKVHLSLNESASAIAHSTLPIIATGDMSLTLALQYEKPFIYETQPWKRALARDLAKLFNKNIYGLNFEDLILESRNGIPDEKIKLLAKFLFSAQFSKSWKTAVSELKSQRSFLKVMHALLSHPVRDLINLMKKNREERSEGFEELLKGFIEKAAASKPSSTATKSCQLIFRTQH